MKLLTVAIPCYNSAEYMNKAVESCLAGGKDIEILIVDDGSNDETGRIADDYEFMYPGIVRAIHKENGGHGDAVNIGIRNASGRYFKVLDSDDWLDKDGLARVLKTLSAMVETKSGPDMLIANYVYEKVALGKSKAVRYKNCFPIDTIFTWNDIRHMHYSQNILMHSVIYRTSLLKQCGIELPKHTFYVDNLYVYQPLPYVKTLYYMNVDLYHYLIGRADQSVNEQVMISRIDQQLRVNRIIIDSCHFDSTVSVKLKNYMIQYLVMMMTVSTVYLIKAHTEESEQKRLELWRYLKVNNPLIYKRVNKYFLGRAMQFSSRPGKKIIMTGFSVTKKIYGYNV